MRRKEVDRGYRYLVIDEPRSACGGDVFVSAHLRLRSANEKARCNWRHLVPSERKKRRILVAKVCPEDIDPDFVTQDGIDWTAYVGYHTAKTYFDSDRY